MHLCFKHNECVRQKLCSGSCYPKSMGINKWQQLADGNKLYEHMPSKLTTGQTFIDSTVSHCPSAKLFSTTGLLFIFYSCILVCTFCSVVLMNCF